MSLHEENESERRNRAAVELIARTYCDKYGNPSPDMPPIVVAISDLLILGETDVKVEATP